MAHPKRIVTELARLFDILKTRMTEHDDYLRRSEYNTRILLIDPVLRKLGWDVEEPELVQMEVELARPKGLRADYVLLEHGEYVAIVEAKSFGRDLRDGRGQAVEYAGYADVPLFVLTDGNLWQLYRRGRGRGSSKPFRIMEFDIQFSNSTDLAKTALVLRQPSFDLGQPIDSAPNPIFKINQSTKRRARPSAPSSSSLPEGSPWCPVSELSFAGQQGPKYIKFPDGIEMKFVRPGWIGVPFNLVRWLVDTGQLHKHCLPVKRDNGELLIVASPIGKPRPVRPGFYMNQNRSSQAHFSDALDLMRQFEIDPTKVFVNFGGGRSS